MVLLFVAMLLVRRRQMLSKKTMTPSRSNGGVLTTPISSRHDAPPLWLEKDTLPDYSATLPEYSKLTPSEYSNGCIPNGQLLHNNINLHPNPLHQKEYSRPDKLDYDKSYSNRKYNKDYGSMQVQEYASPNLESNRTSQIADYAEVDANLANQDSGAISPAPYATTTLVTGNRRIGNSMVILKYTNYYVMLNVFLKIWQRSPNTPEESPYPSSNGGYYNRKVYSDSYFAPTQTLRRSKKERKSSNDNPPDLVSPTQPVYARVGPPGMSWRGNCGPSMTSFTPHHKQVYHASTRSEPGGNML